MQCLVLLNSEKEMKYLKKIKGDIVILTTSRIVAKQIKNSIYIDVFSNEYEENLISETLIFFEKLQKYFSKEEYETYIYPNINMFYMKIIKPIFNVIEKMKEIIEFKEIEKIFLLGGNPKKEHIFFNFGEGETIKSKFYERSYFLNYYIAMYFKHQEVIFLKTSHTNSIKFIERDILKLIRILMIISKKKYRKLKKIKKEKKVVFHLRTSTQQDTLKNLILEAKKRQLKVYELIDKNTISKPFNALTSKIEILEFVSFKEIILAIIKTLRTPKQNKNIQIKGIEFSIEEIRKELSIYYFENLLKKMSYKNIFSKSDILVNTEVINQRAACDVLFTIEKNVKVYTIQHVLFGFYNLPKYDWSREIFCWDISTSKELNKLNSVDTFSYLGPTMYDNYYNSYKQANKKLKYCIFTQPDSFSKDYKVILREINKLKTDKIEFFLKLHPRDTIKNYRENMSNITLIEGTIDEILTKIDLTISIHSSVLNQSIIVGVPTLTLHGSIDDYMKSVKEAEFLKYCYFLNFNFDMKKILDSNFIFHKSQELRKKYLEKNIPGYTGNATQKIANKIYNIQK
ncbi:MAG: hypothetical protein WBG30_03465 [Psychrilyobacter sp.]|uniref:hypothetical protein n=1 Tax=Psychrilyobacter sp. TaxID=2586924 RepID=UPI003C724F8B